MRICELKGCDKPVIGNKKKRFCSTKHRVAAHRVTRLEAAKPKVKCAFCSGVYEIEKLSLLLKDKKSELAVCENCVRRGVSISAILRRCEFANGKVVIDNALLERLKDSVGNVRLETSRPTTATFIRKRSNRVERPAGDLTDLEKPVG